MLDFVGYMYILVINLILGVILIILTRYQLDLAIDLMDKQISNKMKTFGATMSRRRGSDREPSNIETIVDLGRTFLALKQEGVSIKDILAEFGGSVVEEAAKQVIPSEESS